MARTIAEIQDQIIAGIQADADLAGINSPSKRALWRLWTYIVAVAISVFEQILDIAKSDFESIVRAAPPATAEWIRDRMLEFQYDADNPQFVQLQDLIPSYSTVDETLRIITRCSVNVGAYNSVLVKVAKNDPPEALAPEEVDAAQYYMNVIGVAGIHYLVASMGPDRLYINAEVYHKGSLGSTVIRDVIEAVRSYLADIPFDGLMKIVDLIDAMKSVPGVTDVVLHNVGARGEAVAVDEMTMLIENNTQLKSKWPMLSGYMIEEDTPGYTFIEKLNFISQ